MSVDGGNDLQIIYELRWKSDIGNRYNTDKVNIMGILDTADTCADWTSFKSYLMQNSGAKEDTIIAYVDNDGEEIQINSENYQSTLEYCREKARKHEKVILILKKPKSLKEHQHKSLHNRMKQHHEKIIGSGRRHHEFCSRRHFPNPFYFVADISDSEGDDEQPPLWFLKYMKKFKQEMSDLIVESMYCMRANDCDFIPPPFAVTEQVQVVSDKKKNKKKFCDEDSSDCVDGVSLGDRLLKKVHKLQAREKKIERKYEAKIGKLEHKVKRIIDKKTGLRSEKPHTSLGSTVVSKPKKHCSASAQNSTTPLTYTPAQPSAPPCQAAVKVDKPKRHCYSKSYLPTKNYENEAKTVSFKTDKSTSCCENYTVPDEVVAMNAIPLNRQMITEFAGRGEIITKRWEVMNNGLSPWTDETELRFTWGSSTLVPLTKVVKVPHLKPGETGIVEVTMQAPDALGRFESYWYFFHSGVRFGHWLGCAYVIGLQKDDRCRMPESAVDLTITKCPRYNCTSVDTNKCSRYHHISATTDDMKMSKTNAASPAESQSTPVDYVVGKPDKYIDEAASTQSLISTVKETLNLISLTNDSILPVECLKPKPYREPYEPIQPNSLSNDDDELLNLDNTIDKINDKTVPDLIVDGNQNEDDEEIHCIETVELNSDSDSDNISVISGTISVGSTDHGDDFVLIPMPVNNQKMSLAAIADAVIADIASNSNVSSTTGLLEENDNNTEEMKKCSLPVDKPSTYVQSTSETEVDKPTCYEQSPSEIKVDKPTCYVQSSSKIIERNDLKELNKVEKPSCYVSSTTETNDTEKSTENEIVEGSINHVCPLKHLDSETYQTRPSIFAHCNFGDPNCGSGPNGPRFPPSSCKHTSQTSHPTWRNGCSAFGNDFATCDQTKKPETTNNPVEMTRAFEAPYIWRPNYMANSENCYYPYPGCIHQEFVNHSHDSNTRRFVFNNSGTGFETYPQQVSENSSNDNETNVECEVRKPARYSYVYGEGRPIPTSGIPKPDPPQPSTNFEIPISSSASSSTNGVHILPETIVNGAIQVAANAFNTACNVYDLIRGEGENNNNTNSGQRTPSSQGIRTPPYATPSPTNQRRMSASSNDTSRSGSGQTNPRSLDNCLHILYEMGFYNRELNIKLLKRYNNDLPMVISKLV